jgi:hypothetical protein
VLSSNVAKHAPLQIVTAVDRQAFVSQARRLMEAMDFVGSPFSAGDVKALDAAMELDDDAKAIADTQTILNRYALIDVHINPEARVKLKQGECAALLQEQGWRDCTTDGRE